MLILENNQLFPFERNRYYVGKLLTSADFLAEQNYMNNKRRFMNQMMFGSGIVCGLSVYNLDDLSIMIESGIATDDFGREMVLESSVVKKLSAIEGFADLQTDNVTLCARYQETPVHPVYCITAQNQSEEYEKNRIQEGIAFFLMDTEKLPPRQKPVSDFLNSYRIYSDNHYIVDVMIPANVACGAYVKGMACVTKLSEEEAAFSMDSTLQTPAFESEMGNHEVLIQFQDLYLKQGETATEEFWLLAQSQPADNTILIGKSGHTKITVGDEAKRLADNFIIKLKISPQLPEDIITEEIGKISLENRLALELLDFLPIAQLQLQRTKNAYFIESVTHQDAENYVFTGSTFHMRREMSEYFRKKGETANAVSQRQNNSQQEIARQYSEPVYASGICEISLGIDAKKGDVLFSDEIMHGLGKGNVYVDVGVEYLTEDLRIGRIAKSTIYGDADLFAKEQIAVPFAQTAVKVLNERGSFVVAAKLLEDTEYCLLPLRWVAFKLPSLEDVTLFQRMAGKSIDAEQPTAVIATRENHFFNVRFKNMEPCALIYELTEQDSGSITKDGIYTAPAKEGVYEIKISCVEYPMISTYAYAIVKKREQANIEG